MNDDRLTTPRRTRPHRSLFASPWAWAAMLLGLGCWAAVGRVVVWGWGR